MVGKIQTSDDVASEFACRAWRTGMADEGTDGGKRGGFCSISLYATRMEKSSGSETTNSSSYPTGTHGGSIQKKRYKVKGQLYEKVWASSRTGKGRKGRFAIH